MGVYSAAVIALGPLFYYRLNETSGLNAADSSGNGRTGTYTGSGVTYSAAGLLNSDPGDTAVALDGVNGYVSLTNSLYTDTFTLEAWIKPSSTAGQGYIIGSSASGAGGVTMLAGGQIAADKTGLVQICNSGAHTVTAGTVHHVVYTKNGAANHLYLDGVDVTAGLANQTCAGPTATTIGQVVGVNRFPGVIDEAAVYGFALTAGQVLANYNNGVAGPPATPTTALPQPLVSVEVAFANNPLTPLASLTWTTIPAQLVGPVTCSYGRSHELRRIEAAQLSVRFTNFDGRFSPWNTASPYYGPFTDGADTGVLGLVPGKRIRVRATWGGTTYNLWHGFVAAWPQTWPHEKEAYVDVTAVDASTVLNLVSLGSVFAETIKADATPGGLQLWMRLGDVVNSPRLYSTIPTATTGASINYGTPGVGVTLGSNSLLPWDPTTSAGYDGTLTANVVVPWVNLPATDFTVECVVATNSQPQGCLLFQQPGRWASWFIFVNSTGAIQFQVTDFTSAVTSAASANTNVSNGNPHHIACTYVQSTKTATVYLDGVSVASTSGAATVTVNGALIIGGDILGNSETMTGRLQDARLWFTALSAGTVLAHYNAASGLAGQTTGARVGSILNLAGWPTADRTLETGSSTMAGTTLGTSALAAINAAEDAEAGMCFLAPDGTMTFYGRAHTIVNAHSVTSQITLGESNEPYQLSGTLLGADDLDIWNDVNVTRQGGTPQVVGDPVSVTRYGKRTMPGLTGLQMADDAQAGDMAHYLLNRYKTPMPRLSAINVHPADDANNLFPQVLGRVLWDRVTVTRAAPGGGTLFSQQSLIEKITHTITPDGDWHTTWALSPADAAAAYWVLQDATFGALNSTTTLFW